MTEPESFEEVSLNIKACLNSSKRQISISDLNRDYDSILGTPIPYRALGYRSLEALVRAIPDLKISHVGGELFLDVKVDEKTAHITNLVRGQKSPKKKSANSYRKYGYRKAPAPRRLSPPKSYSKNTRYGGSQYIPAKQYPAKNYCPQYKAEPRPNAPKSYEPRASVPKIPDPRNSASRYNSEPSNKNQYYPVPQYSSQPNSVSHNHVKDYNQNGPPSPKFSPTYLDCEDVPIKKNSMEHLQVTSGNSRKVIVGKQTSRKILTKHNSIDEDFAYSSMNEIQNPDFTKLSDTDLIISNTRKMSLKHSPAAMVAAGRAQIEPSNKKTAPNVEIMDTCPIDFSAPSDMYHHPFKMVKKHPATTYPLPDLFIDTNSAPKSATHSHSSPMYGKTSPPAMSSPNTPNPTIVAAKQTSSKMSDPYMFTPGPHIAPDCTEGTACGRLMKYARARNLPSPEFKNFNKPDSRTGIKYFLSRVKIGDFNFSSFQLESSNLKDAQEYVANVALEDLRRRLDSVDSAALPITNDETLIINRVAEIVNPHMTGLKASYVENQYKILHREILPFNWTDVIAGRSLLSVEESVGGLIVYPASDKNSNAANVTSLPPLILPPSDTWNVYVTFVHSSNRIYFRIIHDDYDGRFAVMSENMNTIYSSAESKKQPIEIVREGNFYAALMDDQWFRVKAMGTGADDGVIVLLIDFGEDFEVSKDSIFPLDEQLTELPAQAVRCGLTNLEEHCNNAYITEVIECLISDKPLVAKVNSRNPRLQLTLHDTCTDEDVNINELVLKKVKNELTPPKIPAKNSLTQVHLTSVDENGQAYVRLMSDSLDVLEEHLEKVNEDLLENEDDYVIKDAKELVGVKMCLVKYIEDGKWHRGVIQELVPDENEAQVLYVDYGSREAVPFDRIADCQRISSILSEIPPQAILVELVKPTQEIFTERIIDFLLNLASPKTPFMMKVVEDRNVPYVELFLRLDHNEEFHSVNDLIGTCFNEYRGKNFKMITISKELNEKFRPIPAFPLPQPMAEFYVYIYMVSHPHLFFVQPHDFRPKLKELMRVMDEFYSKEAPAVNIDDLTKGQVYAVKCEDNMWYRGTCHQIIESENSISVKLVDYGNIISVKFKDISHLLPCFRELPCLAIKAELAGIAPKNKDWDLRDCIRFKDLVYEKVLISFIADVAEKVSMVLYDTSMGGEVDIGAQLVMEGHAVDITER